MEAIPLADTSVAACAKALTFSWISCFGVPETITSDHGLQFTSNLWFKLCEMLNISHRQTTAYYPEPNGAVERLHCCLKDTFRAASCQPSSSLPPSSRSIIPPLQSLYDGPYAILRCGPHYFSIRVRS
jgi:transposase InsO family protein